MPGLSDCFAKVLDRLAPGSASSTSTNGPAIRAEGGPGSRLMAACIRQVFGSPADGRLIEALTAENLLDPSALDGLDRDALAARYQEAVGKPASPKDLQIVLRAAAALGRLEPEAIEAAPTTLLRELLRGVRGLGPGTVDSILLEGLGRPVFPVTLGRYRVLARHGWVDPWATYDDASETVGPLADSDLEPAAALARLGEGMDRVARRWCKASRADCTHCPLEPFLPAGGPVTTGGGGDDGIG